MRRAALIILITGVYIGCARPPISPPIEPVPAPETPSLATEPEPAPSEPPVQPRPGGTLRLSLSFAERDALAYYGLIQRDGEAPFTSDRIDRWSRLAPETLLDHVVFVSDQRIEAVELFLLGQVDLTPVYGRSATRLFDLESERFRLLRAEGWDRTYVLLFDSDSRWTNERNFRRWFAESVDRVDLVSRLFDGHGTPAWNLEPQPGGPRWPPPIVQPFSSTSSPALTLQYDPADRAAASIASRLKALFVAHRLELRLSTAAGEEPPELRLVAHQRWSTDPVPTLTSLAALTGTAGEQALQLLEEAGTAVGVRRDDLTDAAETKLIESALVVPLIRLEAWIAVSAQLEGVEPGLTGQLALERIWWNR